MPQSGSHVVVLVPPGGYPNAYPLGAALFERRLRLLGYSSSLVDLNRELFRGGEPRFSRRELGPTLQMTADGLLTPRREIVDASAASRATDPASVPPAVRAWLERALRRDVIRGARAFFLSASLPTQVFWAFVAARLLKSAFPERSVCGGGSSWSYAMNEPAARRFAESLGLRSVEVSEPAIGRLMASAGIVPRSAPSSARLDVSGLARGGDAVYQLAAGCAYGRCAFCYFPYAGADGSATSPKMIERDLRDLLQTRRARRVFFCDAYLNPEQIGAVLDIVRRISRRIEVSCFTRFDKKLSDGRLLAALRAKGLTDLYMGFESAHPRVLALMRKGIDPKGASENIRALHGAGIRAHLSAIVGFPTETRAEAERTLEFLLEHRPWLDSRPMLFSYTLDAGTPMAENPGAFGIRRVLPSRSLFYPCREVESEGGMSLAEKREFIRLARARLDRSYRTRGVTQKVAILGEQTEVVTGGVL